MFAGAVRNICEGDSTVLPAHVQQGIANGFIWSPAGGLNDPSLLQPNASPVSTTTYSVRAISGNCFSQPANVLVIVHSVPKPDAGFDTTLCSTADSIILQGSFTGGTPPYVTNWSPATGVDIPNIPTPKAMPNSTTMYYFSVKCGTGVSECSSYDSVLVSIVPGIVAQLEADTNIICPGEQVNLNVQAGQGAATYVWSPAAGISNPGSPSTMASPMSSTTYSVFVSEGGCADTATVEILVHPQPIGGFINSQPKGCNPVEVQFNNLSSNAMSHTWNFGDGSHLNNEINPVHTFTESGIYHVELVVRGTGGCLDTFRSDLPITVNERFQADFSSTPPSPVEMANPASEVFFQDRSQSAISWFWDFGDGSTSTEQNPVYKFKLPGKYIVTLKAKNQGGCEGSISKGPYVVFEPELYLPNVFSPNGDGVNDFFAIQYDGDEAFYIQIFDRWGVKYFDTRNKMQYWDGRDLNGKESGEGTYFYTVIIGPRSYSGTVNIVR
jgi:gliding motility-associated-like protein